MGQPPQVTPPSRASCSKGKEKADHTTHAPNHYHPPTTQSTHTHTRKLTKRTRGESLPPPLALSPTEALLRLLLPFKFWPASLPSSTPRAAPAPPPSQVQRRRPDAYATESWTIGKAGAEPHGDQEGQDRTLRPHHHRGGAPLRLPCCESGLALMASTRRNPPTTPHGSLKAHLYTTTPSHTPPTQAGQAPTPCARPRRRRLPPSSSPSFLPTPPSTPPPHTSHHG